jgi:phage terminase large subunit GpA-like protein
MRAINNEILFNIINRLIPPPRMSTSEYAEAYRYIPRGQSSQPGKWRNDRAPHVVEIMDAADDPTIKHMVIMKAARMSVTEALLNIMFKRIEYAPCQILYMLPTVDLAQKFSKKILSKSINDTRSVARLIVPEKSRDSHNTILEKEFPGGDLSIIGSNSPAGTRMVSKELVILDDRAGFPPSSGIEGDPGSLAKTRGDTFYNFKFIEVSSPTVENFCPIEKSFLLSDQRYYYVPCPHCGEEQILLWSGIKWVNHNPKTTIYECCKCGKSIIEKHKYTMMNDGKYRAHEEYRGRAGWHISQLYSLFIPWQNIVSEWLESHDDPEKLKVFVTTKLGETSKEKGDSLNTNVLFDRAEERDATIPLGAGVLTAQVDTQDDRLEILVKAWGRDEESWDIELKILLGNLALPDIWDALDKFLSSPYRHANGANIYISCVLVDSGGHFADQVYQFVKYREHRNIFAIKGAAGPGYPIVSIREKTKDAASTAAGIHLFHIGTHAAKEIVQARLNLNEIKPGYIHLTRNIDHEYFEQLTSEKRVPDYYKGVLRGYKWKKIRPRNEGWDLQVYALAAIRLIYPNQMELNRVVEYINNIIPDSDGNWRQEIEKRRRIVSGGINED